MVTMKWGAFQSLNIDPDTDLAETAEKKPGIHFVADQDIHILANYSTPDGAHTQNA